MVLSILKVILYVLAVLAGIVVLYILTAVVFSVLTVNSGFKPDKHGITIYLKSNGAHVDIYTPLKNEIFDWTTVIDINDFEPGDHRYAAVGWGDKGFYMETPTWNDLSLPVAFRALFIYSESTMHVTLAESISESDRCVAIDVSPEQYRKLMTNIMAKFRDEGKLEPIDALADYYPNQNDRFYPAKGSYWYYETCNVWTSRVLGKAGIKAAIWSPFAWGVMWPHKGSDTR